MPIKLQIRRGTATDWANATPSPTLASGEIGLETDTGNLKIGTGALTWANLGYLASTLPQVSAAGNDFDAAAYRVQGRYEISTSVTTNPPSGWTPASDAPAILTVFKVANGHLVQVLMSVTTQRVVLRGYNGTAYTAWKQLSPIEANAVETANIVDLAVTTAKIADDAVTFAKFQNVSGLSVIGKGTAGSGDVAEITAATSGHVLRHDGTNVSFGQVATAGIADSAVTAAKLSGGFFINRTTLHSSNGNWISPATCRGIRATLVGGGGGGGSSANSGTNGGSGGHGGRIMAWLKVEPGTTYAYTIGLGGAGTNTSPNNGASGTATTFLGISAGGGTGGVANNGGARSASGTVTTGSQPSGVVLMASTLDQDTYAAYPWLQENTRTITSALVWTPTSSSGVGSGGTGELSAGTSAGGGTSGCIEIEWIEYY